MRAWALVVLVILLLSGCSGSGNKSSSSSDSGTSEDFTSDGPVPPGPSQSGSSPTTSVGPNGNHAPVPSLAASAVAGRAPFNVTFTLDATDQDHDALTWSFDADADGTADMGGTALPATVPFTFTTVGPVNATLTVSDGKQTATASKVITVTGAAGAVPLFLDDAEGDAAKWTITSEVVINANAPPSPPVPTGQAHPLGPWIQVNTVAHGGSKSWHAPYPDNYVSIMTVKAPVAVPAAGATLSFWAKGGAEDNGFDGLYVNSGPDATTITNQVYQAVVLSDWTQYSIPVAPGTVVFQFVFQSDVSCSSDPSPTGNAAACGAGFDAGGFWIDDVTVA